MARKKKEVPANDLPPVTFISANEIVPGQHVKLKDGTTVRVISVDPVLDLKHPNLLSNEVVVRISHGDLTRLVLLTGPVELAA